MPAHDWTRWLRRLAHWTVRTPNGVRPRPTRLEDRLAPAAGTAFRGGLTVAAADVTGDGVPDLIGAPSTPL